MTKHIEINCYFVKEKILLWDIIAKFVKLSDLSVDIFSKSITANYICSKLGRYDFYAPTWGGMLK